MWICRLTKTATVITWRSWIRRCRKCEWFKEFGRNPCFYSSKKLAESSLATGLTRILGIVGRIATQFNPKNSIMILRSIFNRFVFREEKVNDTNLETANRWEPKPIPSYLYRIVTQQKVSLSSNDRDQKVKYQFGTGTGSIPEINTRSRKIFQ